MSKIRVLLLFGGESSEHDVSIASARNVHSALDDTKYDVMLCYIDRGGKWWLLDEFSEQIDTKGAKRLLPGMGECSVVTMPVGEELKVDAIFPVLHGRNGEDGSVQGLAQLMHTPIVGCDVTASGIAMNKLAFKEIMEATGIPITPYEVHRAYEDMPEYEKVTRKLGDTLFVKPARAGSSVGVSKVTNEEEFRAALDEAHKHDPIALIEKAIKGQELEVAVLGTPPNHKVSGVGEIIPGEDFYTYEDKYADDSKAKVSSVADVSPDVKERVRKIAADAFEVLDCSNLSRIDYLLGNDGELYVMEVNTLPGFTNISMYPKLWQEEGIGYSELIDLLISDAIRTYWHPTINRES